MVSSRILTLIKLKFKRDYKAKSKLFEVAHPAPRASLQWLKLEQLFQLDFCFIYLDFVLIFNYSVR